METKEDLENLIRILQEGILEASGEENKNIKLHMLHAETRMQEEYLRRFGTIYEPPKCKY